MHETTMARWTKLHECYNFAAMPQGNTSSFQTRRLSSYPIGLIVRVRLVSGREIEGQIVKIEITVLGAFLHVEFDQEVANVTSRQILGFYDFCSVKFRPARTYVPFPVIRR
jgi:hypothetical protein